MPPSLCPGCVHVRLVSGRRGQSYLLCRNPAIPEKYPAQPVVDCAGYAEDSEARKQTERGGRS